MLLCRWITCWRSPPPERPPAAGRAGRIDQHSDYRGRQ
jgi:hypothetical protein